MQCADVEWLPVVGPHQEKVRVLVFEVYVMHYKWIVGTSGGLGGEHSFFPLPSPYRLIGPLAHNPKPSGMEPLKMQPLAPVCPQAPCPCLPSSLVRGS